MDIKNKLKNKLKVIPVTIYVEFLKIIYILFLKKKDDIWLICETENQAQDNGYHFFKYIRENYPQKKVFFLIKESSPDYFKVDNLGNVIKYMSIKHIIYMFQAELILSTHGLWMVPREFGILKKHTKKIIRAKKIMLQHGIIAIKNVEKEYNKLKFELKDGFVVSSEFEKEIVINKLKYTEEEIFLTGLPRMDNLVKNNKFKNKGILLMPTFRKGIDCNEKKFKNSDFFYQISNLLKNKSLNELLSLYKVELNLYLHQNFQQYNNLFKKFENENIKVLEQKKSNFQDILKNNKLMITDYSSVAFDFSYLNKPVIFYQFDCENFLKTREKAGYIDIKKDLFGFRTEKEEEVVKKIENYIEADFIVEKIYKQRLNRYFKFRGQNNCERLYKKLIIFLKTEDE
ncbi:CDP-glycerol glycerophosphotransferase family protein [Psychrilyobacter atlanticus]|uniref:CDP-glycerol glycerophosphotransferase family protein n=1 Tax=Psychrilyobacter atlanticus TaxID=271091 RepID=UPI00040CC0F4|nr:CDP-glycerol glycerophosphotransferase family protein [Psychrilyobacter atlanticus]